LLVYLCVFVSYNHSRDDEEVYKEFLEIANEIIPQILRMDQHDCVLTSDPAAYAQLLRFYDGLCCWEEDSQTPVLHITWATHMLSSISKFSVEARTSVELKADDEKTAASDTSFIVDGTSSTTVVNSDVRPHRTRRRHTITATKSAVGGKTHGSSDKGSLQGLQVATVEYDDSGGSSEVSPATMFGSAGGVDTNQLTPSSDDLKVNLVVDQLASQSDDGNNDDDEGDCSSEIVALAHACCESLLNPDFLRGSGEPFVKDSARLGHQLMSSATATQMDLNAFAACSDTTDLSSDVVGAVSTGGVEDIAAADGSKRATESQPPQLVLHSAKMLALKQLLVASKLNASAIKLHLTAQSQVTRKPTQIRSPLSMQFYMGDYTVERQRRAIKRRSNE